MQTNPSETLQSKILRVLRNLYEMGVTLGGCGCCGVNELRIDGITYDVIGGIERNGSYNYSFHANGQTVLTLVSNGNDENILG